MRFASFMATLIVALTVGVVGIAEAKFRGGSISSFPSSSSASRSYSAPKVTSSVPSIKPTPKPVTPATPKVTTPVTPKPVTKTPTYTPMPVPAAPSTSSSSSMSWLWMWIIADEIGDAVEGDDD